MNFRSGTHLSKMTKGNGSKPSGWGSNSSSKCRRCPPIEPVTLLERNTIRGFSNTPVTLCRGWKRMAERESWKNLAKNYRCEFFHTVKKGNGENLWAMFRKDGEMDCFLNDWKSRGSFPKKSSSQTLKICKNYTRRNFMGEFVPRTKL